MTIVYLARALPGDAVATLGDGFEVRGGEARPLPRSEMLALAKGASVYVPTYLDRVDGPLLDELPRVRLVASYGVGTDHLDLAACAAHRVTVTNTPGVLTEATADLAFALLLAVARRVAEGDRLIRAGQWREIEPTHLLGVDVHGKTLGIVGHGRIGQAMARRAAGFAMRVVHTTSRSTAREWAELLGTSDFVSLHCPLTPATRGLFDAERLAALRPGALLINTARGAIVDEPALLAALERGHLGGAGLDVFPDEPHVSEALRDRADVVLTPHVGSGSREARAAMSRLVVDEIRRFAAGQPPCHPVP